jgi:hypothetical protein
MEDFDEEIDVPNSPLDEYMKQFELKDSDKTLVNKIKESKTEVKNDIVYRKRINEFFERFKIEFLYDIDFIKSLFRNNLFKQVLTNDDENFVYEELLITETKLCLREESFANSVYICLIASMGLFFLLELYTVLFLLMSLSIFIVLLKSAFRSLFEDFISEIFINMNLVQKLFVYLKKVQLVKLDVGKSDPNDVNLKYRCLLFEFARNEYFILKNLSLKFACFTNSEMKLNCKIEQNELNEALKMDIDDEKLFVLTNQYHLNIVNCIIKLNYLQISELVKLILFSYIQNNLNTFFIILIRLIFIKRKFKMTNSSLKRLMSMFQLREIVENEEQTVTTNEKKSRLKVQIESLSLHLRNALLNSYKIQEDGQLNVIEYELDFCLLYLKQIKNELSPKSTKNLMEITEESNEDVTKSEIKTVLSEKQNDKNIKTDVDSYDCIFEALSSENIKDIEIGDESDSSDIEFKLQTRENEIVHTKFYNELKEALVKKKDEWNEREKQAKVIKDEKLVEYEKTLIDTSHLLINENDIMKYKSQLRNRKQTIQKKYEYIEDLRADENVELKMNNSSFLSEFKAKKKEIYKKSNESDESDEIIYE